MILLMIANVSGEIAPQRDLNPVPLSHRRQIVTLTMEGMKTVVPPNIESTGKIGKTYFAYTGENHKCLEILVCSVEPTNLHNVHGLPQHM